MVFYQQCGHCYLDRFKKQPATWISCYSLVVCCRQQCPDGEFSWILCKPGDFIQVPSGAKHAFRNPFAEPAVSIVSTTGKLGRFFQEVGRIVRPGTPVAPPAPEELQHFMDICNRYDYWVAPPEEKAAVGISLF
jgi:hypothetical protein